MAQSTELSDVAVDLQMVREFLGADPLSGHLFVFRNKKGDRIKLASRSSSGVTLRVWPLSLRAGASCW